MKRVFVSAMACASMCAGAAELTGTAYAVVYRGNLAPGVSAPMPDLRLPGFPAARRPAQQPSAGVAGVLRLVDVATRRELARAAYDTRLGGYMLPMPFNQSGGSCLALVDARNQWVLVRTPSAIDNGASFRNPAWEAERSRLADLSALQAERANVDGQFRNADGEIARIQAELGLPEGAVAADCPTPTQEADPPRPVAVVDAAAVPAIAGPLCALRWEQAHGTRVDLRRMFADAGVSGDWQQRGNARTMGEQLAAVQVPISGQDLNLVLDATRKGPAYLEHGDGVRVFLRAHSACRDEVGRQVGLARQLWERAVEDVRTAPQRARQQCAQKIARVSQLLSMRRTAPDYLAALDRRISTMATPASASDSIPLEAQLCQP